MKQAFEVLESGLHEAASLVGAAAFEQALRRFGTLRGLDLQKSTKEMFDAIVQQTGYPDGDDLKEFFIHIIELHNSIMQLPSDQSTLTKDEAKAALEQFDLAVFYLEQWIFINLLDAKKDETT